MKLKLNTKKINLPKTNIFTVILLACMFLALAYNYTRAKNLESQAKQGTSPSPSSIVKVIPSSTPQPTPKPTPTKTVDPDPIIDCKFTYIGVMKLRRSVCNKSTDCQINGKWIYYDSVDKCKADQQVSNNSANTQQNTYPSCTVYYSALGTSQTYLNIAPEQCKQWQDNVKPNTTTLYTPPPTSMPIPTPTPKPTTDPALCSQGVGMWNDYKADFYTNKYSTFSSSAEAMIQLNSEKQIIQGQLNSYGCTNILSL